jgi:hypothetical protein
MLNSKTIRLGLSLAISGISLFLAVRQVSWEEVQRAFSRADWRLTSAAVVSVLLAMFIKVVRWQMLSNTAPMPPGYGRLTLAFLAGQMLNTIYPGRVGELSRAYIAGEGTGIKAFMFGTIVLEKAFDIVAYAVLAVLMVMWMPLPTWIQGSVAGMVMVGMGVLITLGVIGWIHHRGVVLPVSITGWARKIAQRLARYKLVGKIIIWIARASDSLEVLGKPWLMVMAILCTGVIWSIAVLTNFLVLEAFGMRFLTPQESWLASLVILVGLIIGISLPSIPGRIGIFEYICVLSLQLFNVPQALALSYGILLHAIVFIPNILGGLISFLVLGLAKKSGTG